MSSSTVSVSAATPTRHPFQRRIDDVKPSKTDINAVVLDYLISEGYKEAAENFLKEANMQRPPDEEIEVRVDIGKAIKSGDIESAIHKINDFNPQILDTDPSLHFALLRLQLVELIRKCNEDDITPALTFASSQLAPRAATNREFLKDLELTMTLLIVPHDNLPAQLQELLEPKLRAYVADRVNQSILANLGAKREARLRNLVRLRAWAETKCRESSKDIPPRLGLGLDPDNGDADGDEAMNGNGETGDAMVS